MSQVKNSIERYRINFHQLNLECDEEESAPTTLGSEQEDIVLTESTQEPETNVDDVSEIKETESDAPKPLESSPKPLKAIPKLGQRFKRLQEEAKKLKIAIDLPKPYTDSSSLEKKKLPKRKLGQKLPLPEKQQLSSNVDKLMEKSVLKPGIEKLDALPPYEESVRREKAQRKTDREKSKGKNWYDLPATELTEEKQRDLEILQMRSVLNPKQFYKKNDLKVLPKYFQIGKVLDSPADFYHSRVPIKERKKTLVEELMADAEFQQYNKRKYADIITEKQKLTGSFRHAKRLKSRKK
uniref:EOG090X0GO7 n=1 Tax=Lynceus sp. MCZ IZ 141354 TaxID=1930659 RepID=A0A9N6WTK4_9CRUS|nr:EOG090X0GO7 [Lynceus sp. MCZ IZ 141354]